MKAQHIQHLYWRAGLGISPAKLSMLSHQTRDSIVNTLFKASKRMTPLEIDTSDLEGYTRDILQNNKKKQKEFRKASREKVKDLNLLWIDRLVNPWEDLRERMTLFWANVFVCENSQIYHTQNFNNTLREHALGDFGDFVKAISKEAAMIQYLNGNENIKQKPNENFSRELMELFTLGEGHYSENDVKESARAFTGYAYFSGNFVIRKKHHDYNYKSFLGHTGRYDGDDIIDIILEQKQCARFICRKIYSYFVNESINELRVEELATRFYKDYDIKKLMKFIFSSDWFYDNENIGSKIKSPVELLVGIRKTVPVTFDRRMDMIKIQKLLGQILLFPPNVAGWKGGKSWIDSNTIMLRLKLPSIILANAEISVKERGEFTDAFEQYHSNKKKNNFLTVKVDWETFDEQFKNVSINELLGQLIVGELNSGTETYLQLLSQSSKKDVCIQLMSLPEYQMC